MKVFVREMDYIVGRLPELAAADQSWFDTVRGDLFLAISGFEERSLGIARALSRASNFTTSAYIVYDHDSAANRALRPELVDLLSGVSRSPARELTESARLESVRTLLAEIRQESGTLGLMTVVVDITGASCSLLFRLVSTLLTIPRIDLTLVYSEAATYYPTRSDYLTRGPEQPTHSASTAGSLGLDVDSTEAAYAIRNGAPRGESLPTRAVVVPGFSSARVRTALSYIDPALLSIDAQESSIDWLVGDPPAADLKWRTEAMLRHHGIADFVVGSHVRMISTLDYRDTMRALEEIYENSANSEEIVVAPFGSKMQTVGVALFSRMRRDVEVVTADAVEYNADSYTLGIGRQWRLPLGSTGSLVAELESIDEIIWVETE